MIIQTKDVKSHMTSPRTPGGRPCKSLCGKKSGGGGNIFFGEGVFVIKHADMAVPTRNSTKDKPCFFTTAGADGTHVINALERNFFFAAITMFPDRHRGIHGRFHTAKIPAANAESKLPFAADAFFGKNFPDEFALVPLNFNQAVRISGMKRAAGTAAIF